MTRSMDAGTALRDATHHTVNIPSPVDTHRHPIVYGYDGMPTMTSPLGSPPSHLPRAFPIPNAHLSPGATFNPYAQPHLMPPYPLSPVYNPINEGLGSPGLGINDLDDMKRALDLSSLPVNPMTGTMPFIDPATASNENAAVKKARYSPLPSPGQPGSAASVGFNPNQYGATSPLHFGGPLATPTVQGRQANNALTVPSTPIMGMMGMNGMGYNGAFMNYPTSPILSPSMNPNIMTGNYGPAAAAAAAAAAGNLTGRTVYVGNLPADASVDELLNLVRFGPIESVRLLPERSCVFISFLDGSTAAGFHADAQVKKLALHGQELKIGWGKASNLSSSISQEVSQNQATRNVFVGGLDESTTEQDLRDALSSFGPIDQVKIVRDKNIGFVHFLSIATAIQVVAELPHVPGYEEKRVSYGKDRCAYVPKAQQAAVQLAQQQALAAVQAQHGQMPGSPFATFSPMTPNFNTFSAPNTPGFGSPVFPSNGFPVGMNGSGFAGTPTFGNSLGAGFGQDPANQLGNRNIYLGNLMAGTTTEELCNNIRGGQLQHIKHMQDKNIAFVTFVDPNCAQNFYNHATATGLTLNTRRLKIGWGKHSGVISPALLQAIQSGASRNVYIGQILDFKKFTEERLRQDFGQYGEIEMINFLKEKGAAFVNFTSIVAAQAAIEAIKDDADYADMRISYGKDRCGNMPRSTVGNIPRPGPVRTGSQLSGVGAQSPGRTPTNGAAGNSSPGADAGIASTIAAAEARLSAQATPPGINEEEAPSE